MAGLTTTVIVLVGYSAMAGAVGGGLGTLAPSYGHRRSETGFMLVIIAVLIVIVTAVRLLGDAGVRLLSRRERPADRAPSPPPPTTCPHPGRLPPGRPAPGVPTIQGEALLVRTHHRITAPLAAAAALALAGCGTAPDPERGAAGDTSAPLTVAEEAGLDLRVREFDDHVLPNATVDNGEVDANVFQHRPYLDDFDTKQGTAIVPVTDVHLEPLGLYSSSLDVPSGLAEGHTVAIPDDATTAAARSSSWRTTG